MTRTQLSIPVFLGALLLAARLCAADAPAWSPPTVDLAKETPYPRIACTAEELKRLRDAWKGEGDAHGVVARRVDGARKAVAKPVEYPPRGGQHNQWYQCDACQVSLKTVDATHHKCPKCDKVYSGEPYDDVIFARTHNRNLARMHQAAWAYAITGEDAFAEFATGILLGYADRYNTYPYHGNTRNNPIWKWISGGRLFEQTLNEACAMSTRIAPAYDLVHDWPGLTAEQHAHIRAGLIEPMLKGIDRYKAGIVNWQTWHNAAMFTGGAVIGDVGWMQKAVHGGGGDSLVGRMLSWAENVKEKSLKTSGNSFLFQMAHAVTPDGMWYEQSWGYHFYALQALVIQAEAARRVGVDLWHHPGFDKMFTTPALYTMPTGQLPRFGDDVGTSARGRSNIMEPAYAALGEPAALLPLLVEKPTWESVLLGRTPFPLTSENQQSLESAVFRTAGHAILRTSGPAGLVTAFTFAPAGGYHAHFDKLSFVFFGYGKELGVDPGRAKSQAYRLPIHRGWYKATISHNTVLVDGTSQANAGANLLLFSAVPGCAAVAARATTVYSGIDHRRLLVQLENALLVVDTLSADTPHTYSWTYHSAGKRAESATARTKADLAAFKGGEYIKDAREGVTNDDLRVGFAGGAVSTDLILAGTDDTRCIAGSGPFASIDDRIPLAIASRTCRRTTFAALLLPRPSDQPSPKSGIACANADQLLTVDLTLNGKTVSISWDRNKVLNVLQDGQQVLSTK